MATWDDVDALAMALPEVTGGLRFGERTWKVGEKTFVWDRPLRKNDLAELGDAAPRGAILGVRTVDVDEQLALIDGEADYCFVTNHFAGYPAVLIQLDRIPVDRLKEIITDAWLVQAPKRLAKGFLAGP